MNDLGTIDIFTDRCGTVNRYFLLLQGFLRNNGQKKLLHGQRTRGSVDQVGLPLVAGYPITDHQPVLFPPLTEQAAIVERVKALMKTCRLLET